MTPATCASKYAICQYTPLTMPKSGKQQSHPEEMRNLKHMHVCIIADYCENLSQIRLLVSVIAFKCIILTLFEMVLKKHACLYAYCILIGFFCTCLLYRGSGFVFIHL